MTVMKGISSPLFNPPLLSSTLLSCLTYVRYSIVFVPHPQPSSWMHFLIHEAAELLVAYKARERVRQRENVRV